jgi:uncharacterized tellurite resistance protein B-like protein
MRVVIAGCEPELERPSAARLWVPDLTKAAPAAENAKGVMTMKDRLPLVADLLMEAAHADERLEGEETEAVKRLLAGILEVPNLPMDLAFRIDEFDAKTFDRAAVTKAFAADPPDLKKRLLELIAAVHAADGEIDFAEDDHLRAVGAALGLPAESFKELVVDVIEEVDLGDDLDRLRYG